MQKQRAKFIKPIIIIKIFDSIVIAIDQFFLNVFKSYVRIIWDLESSIKLFARAKYYILCKHNDTFTSITYGI